MLKNKKTDKGFTIIEVMIVLAIAGLIMLIVFLAVPALQRNSRNTQRKNDVSGLLGATAEWSNNHNGALPATAAEFTAAITNAKLGFYAATDVTYNMATGAVTNPNDVNKIIVVKGAKCDTTTIGNATRTGASARALVSLYTVETGGGTDKLCQES